MFYFISNNSSEVENDLKKIFICSKSKKIIFGVCLIGRITWNIFSVPLCWFWSKKKFFNNARISSYVKYWTVLTVVILRDGALIICREYFYYLIFIPEKIVLFVDAVNQKIKKIINEFNNLEESDSLEKTSNLTELVFLETEEPEIYIAKHNNFLQKHPTLDKYWTIFSKKINFVWRLIKFFKNIKHKTSSGFKKIFSHIQTTWKKTLFPIIKSQIVDAINLYASFIRFNKRIFASIKFRKEILFWKISKFIENNEKLKKYLDSLKQKISYSFDFGNEIQILSDAYYDPIIKYLNLVVDEFCKFVNKILEIIPSTIEYIFKILKKLLNIIFQHAATIYKFIFTKSFAVEDSIMWEEFPDIPPVKYHFLNQQNYEKKYQWWDINKHYLINLWIRTKNLMKENYEQKKIQIVNFDGSIGKLKTFLIKHYSIKSNTEIFEYQNINHQYDRIIIDKKPENLSIIYGNYSNLNNQNRQTIFYTVNPTFLIFLWEHIKYKFFIQLDKYSLLMDEESNIYDLQKNHRHLINYFNQHSTQKNQFLSSITTDIFVTPFNRKQYLSHFLIIHWKNLIYQYLFVNNLGKKQSNELSMIIDADIYEYDDNWQYYGGQGPMRKKPSLWSSTVNFSVSGESIDRKLGINYENIWKIGIIKTRLQNWNIKNHITEFKQTGNFEFNHFFHDYVSSIKSHKLFVKYQHRNNTLLNKLKNHVSFYEKQRQLLKQEQKLFVKNPLKAFYDYKNLLEIFAFAKTKQPEQFLPYWVNKHPELEVYPTRVYQSFIENYSEEDFVLSDLKNDVEAIQIHSEYFHSYLSKQELTIEINQLIETEINAMHKLLNEQEFMVLPFSPVAINYSIKQELDQMNDRFDYYGINKRKIRSNKKGKDVYIDNHASKNIIEVVEYEQFIQIFNIEVVKQHLTREEQYFKKINKEIIHKSAFYNSFPFEPLYEREYNFLKRNKLKNWIGKQYINESETFSPSGLSRKFEDKVLWDDKDCCYLNCYYEQKINEKKLNK